MSKLLLFFDKKEKVIFFLLVFFNLTTVLFDMFGFGFAILLLNLFITNTISIPLSNIFVVSYFNEYLNNLIYKDKIYFILILIFIFFTIKNLLTYIYFIFESRFSFYIHLKYEELLFKNLLNSDYAFHKKNHSSKLISKIRNNLSYLTTSISCLLIIFTEAQVIIGFFFIFFFIQQENFILLAKIIIVILFLSFLFYFITNNFIKKLGDKRVTIDSLRIKKLQESFQIIKEIKVFNNESMIINNYKSLAIDNASVLKKFFVFSKLPKIYLELLLIVSLVSVVFYYSTYSMPQRLLLVLFLFAIAVYRIVPSVLKIINAKNFLNYSNSALLDIYNDVFVKKNKLNNFLKKILSFKSIIFNSVFFSHKKSDTLKNIKFKISKGDLIGVVGPSGSGKSTFIDLVLGLLKPDKGSIMINNIDTKSKKINLLDHVSYVPQQVYLFDDTLMSNILFSTKKKIDYKMLKIALNISQLDKMVDKLPLGLDTRVGEFGSNFSKGEVQRIAIARALYRNKDLVVMDEPTSALDSKTENKIINSLVHYIKLKRKTLIIVTHRMKILNNYFKVIKIEGNRVKKVR
jgi:ABC-type multidrug transport system fused ATPase/permease subunit